MKFTTTKADMLNALNSAVSAVNTKSTTPVLNNVLLSVSGDRLTITGNDLEVESSDSCEVSVESEGSITAPAGKLLQIVKAIGNNAITFELSGYNLLVSSKRSKFTLSTLPSSDYPTSDDVDFDSSFNIKEFEFKYFLNSITHSMASQDVRYFLNGAMLRPCDGYLEIVSTDGHRLTKNELKTDCVESSGVIIPRKAVTELSKILDVKSDELLTVNLNSNHFQVIRNNLKFTSKLIDGKYPDYQAAIPKNITQNVVIKKDDLKEALTSASILANEKFKGVRLQFAGNTLKVSANNPEGENAAVEIEIDNTDSLEIGFNVAYMLDAINLITDEFVNLALTGTSSSALMTSDSSDTIHVLMPIRL